MFDKTKWHAWFAWRPVRIHLTNERVWLRKIYRRQHRNIDREWVKNLGANTLLSYKMPDLSWQYITFEQLIAWDHSNDDSIHPILISTIRHVMPGVIASQIIGTQPMPAPAGQIYTLKARYKL